MSIQEFQAKEANIERELRFWRNRYDRQLNTVEAAAKIEELEKDLKRTQEYLRNEMARRTTEQEKKTRATQAERQQNLDAALTDLTDIAADIDANIKALGFNWVAFLEVLAVVNGNKRYADAHLDTTQSFFVTYLRELLAENKFGSPVRPGGSPPLQPLAQKIREYHGMMVADAA